MASPTAVASTADSDGTGTATFAALACATTWTLAQPAATAWMQHRTPPPYAIAFHAGGHLDNFGRAPRTDLRLQILYLLVLAALATVAARSLSRAKA